MALNRIAHVNLDTGEVHEHATMALLIKRASNGFGRWFAVNQEALIEMAKRRESMNGEAYAVLFYLLGNLEYENELAFTQAGVARELGMAHQNVSRAVKKLTGIGLLLEGRKIGNVKSYKLNPDFGWRGTGKNHRIALANS